MSGTLVVQEQNSSTDDRVTEERLEDVIALICVAAISVYMVYGDFISPTYLLLVASVSAALAITFTAALRANTWSTYVYFGIVMIGPALSLSYGMPGIPGAGEGTIGSTYFLYFGLGSMIGRKLFPARSAS